MSFVLYYASKAHMRITQVRMASEADVREWYGKCSMWTDVVRIRCTEETSGNVLADQVFDSRIETDAVRELVMRMDRVFTASRHFRYPAERAEAKERTALTNTKAEEKCRCGHLRLQHSGADGNGSCVSECPCRRFWRSHS